MIPGGIDENTKKPALAVYDNVDFVLQSDNGTETSVRISPQNIAKYLDVNDLKVKIRPHMTMLPIL